MQCMVPALALIVESALRGRGETPAIARTGGLPWRASWGVGPAGAGGAHRGRAPEAGSPDRPARPGRRWGAHHPAGPVVRHRPVLETSGRTLRQRTHTATRTHAARPRG